MTSFELIITTILVSGQVFLSRYLLKDDQKKMETIRQKATELLKSAHDLDNLPEEELAKHQELAKEMWSHFMSIMIKSTLLSIPFLILILYFAPHIQLTLFNLQIPWYIYVIFVGLLSSMVANIIIK
jgi:hypothetical protein